MRKTSHDGLDSTSITSGIENEIKKAGQGLLKSKKNSIKRKVPDFSHESDDGIIEPLLQTDKNKTENANRSAKYMLAKTKTDSISEVEDLNIVSEHVGILSAPTPISTTNKVPSNNTREYPTCTTDVYVTTSIHNQKHIRGTSTSETGTNKNSILVEFDGNKTIYSPSPLIFTTAKIHSDSKTKLMEPVPILSTVEVNDNSGVISGESSDKIMKHDVQQLNLKSFSNMSHDKTFNEILSLKDISKFSQSGSQTIVGKLVSNNADSKLLMTSESEVIKNICNAKSPTKEIGTLSWVSLKGDGKDLLHTVIEPIKKKVESKEFGSNKIVKEESASQGQKSYEVSDKQISTLSKSNSKKLQRQKKTTVEDVSTSDNINKDTVIDKKPVKTSFDNTMSSNSCQITTNTGTIFLANNKLTCQASLQSSSRICLPQHKSSLNTTNKTPIVTSTINKISTEVKPDKSSTTSTKLPYIVPTSKTKIESVHTTDENDSVSKPETSESLMKSLITIPKEIVTTTTSNIVPREAGTKTPNAVIPHDKMTKTTSTVTPREARTKTNNIVKPHETVTKTTCPVSPRQAITKTDSNEKSPEEVTKSTSAVSSQETVSKTTSTIKSDDKIMKTSTTTPREAITKTTTTVIAGGTGIKPTTAVTPLESKTTNVVKSREVVPKTTSIALHRETSSKSTSAVASSEVVTKTISTVTPCKPITRNTSSAIPREVIKSKTTIPHETIPKTMSAVTSHETTAKDTHEAVIKNKSTVTPCSSTTKTTNTVTPRGAVKKTTSSAKLVETNSKTNSCTTPRDVLIKTTGSRDSVTPTTSADCKTTRSASSSNVISRTSSQSKQTESKISTLTKDRRA